MPKTLIRRAVRDDFPVLLRLDQICFAPGIAYDSGELEWYLTRRGAEAIVLEADGEIAAFLILELNPRKRKATMVTLDVHPDHRRHGYAHRLLMRSEEILAENGLEFYELQVDVENTPAIAFYVKHGFRQTRTIEAYYANGHDAYLMLKKLPTAAGR